VRNVELVFKNGVAYDPGQLEAAAAGTLGEYTPERLATWPLVGVLAVLVVWQAARIRRRRQTALAVP
jgi:hypothetical protein